MNKKDFTPEQRETYEVWEKATEDFLIRNQHFQKLLDAQNKCRELGVPGFVF